MPVAALHKGEVNVGFDGWFIFGETNADVVNWYYVSDRSVPDGRRLLRTEVDTSQFVGIFHLPYVKYSSYLTSVWDVR